MNDIYLRYVWSLPVSVLGFTVPDRDGNYNVYINGRAAQDRQIEALDHELRHIRRNDFCQALGFEFTYHQLRRTYATILYSADVDALTAKSLLGHSDVKVTIGIYTHLEERKKQLSIDKLNEFLT